VGNTKEKDVTFNVFKEPLPKRFFDIMLASVGLILSISLRLTIALAIKLEDGGPVLFSEEHWGWGWTVFKIHKCVPLRKWNDRDPAGVRFCAGEHRSGGVEGQRSKGAEVRGKR
jgi:lipopolysaccharide/colanic/teichoic acid biosynthesis glycosyltransferase